MLNLIRLLFSSFVSMILIAAFACLIFIGNLAPIIDSAVTEQDLPDYEQDFQDYEPLFELTRDEEAYQKSLKDVNALRKTCFYGTNQYLSGNVTAVVLYVNDFESSWTDELKDEFTEKDIKPALEFLENEAGKYDIELDFDIKVLENAYYDGEVVINYGETGYYITDVLDKAAESYDFYSEFELLDWMKQTYGTEIVFITVFNKAGSSYGMNPKPWQDQERVEHTVTFAIDLDNQTEYEPGTCASIIVNNILHLYGCENLNRPQTRKNIALRLYPDDIARRQPFDISESYIADATAYYIGWTDDIPEEVYSVGWNEPEPESESE